MKSDEVDPVCGLYTKLRIRSEKYRPDGAKIDLRLKQRTLFSVHPGERTALFVKPDQICAATQGGQRPRGDGESPGRSGVVHDSIERARMSLPGNIGEDLERAPAVKLFCGRAPEAGLANAD